MSAFSLHKIHTPDGRQWTVTLAAARRLLALADRLKHDEIPKSVVAELLAVTLDRAEFQARGGFISDQHIAAALDQVRSALEASGEVPGLPPEDAS